MLVRAELPAGYYSLAEGQKDETLKTALHQIVKQHVRIDYGAKGTWVVFRTSDVRPDGSIWDMYSNEVRLFPEAGSHPDMNIEHSVPKSWWGDSYPFIYDASYDLHHLVPSDASANMAKSNNILGEVQDATFDNGVSRTGNVTVAGKSIPAFEPANEYKGDFARMYMYVATCYQDYNWVSNGVYMFDSEPYPTLNAYSRELLMRWHRSDPVSEKELVRNEAVYAAQRNRNPFIDYPLLAEYLWGDSIGKAFHTGLADYPRLFAPLQGQTVDMGTVMEGSVATYSLPIKACNLTAPLNLSWKAAAGFSLSANTIPAVEAEQGVQVEIRYSNDGLSGMLRDTLVIAGGGLYAPVELPISLQGTPAFIVLPATHVKSTEALLHCVAMPQAESYRWEVFEGASEATDLFISAYLEGSSYNKAIALYNGTSRSVCLSDYGLGRQQNGNGTFVDYMALPDVLLGAGETYVLVNSSSANEELRACADMFAPSGEHSPLNFNGNDAVALYRNRVMIDIVGWDGVAENWGKDVTLYRSYDALGPSLSFDLNDWNAAPMDDCSAMKSHRMTAVSSQPVLVASATTNDCSYLVSGLRPSAVYMYKVTVSTPAGDVAALYGTLFKTSELGVPVLRQPSDITCDSFIAQWNVVDGADGYEIDCFSLTGAGQVTETEGFDGVGASGTPLPLGWTGTASGNYTSAASSGAMPPSVGLKANGQYIESPYFTSPVAAMSFMYRFASAGTGSYLSVEKLSEEEWTLLKQIEYVNTSKHTASYLFDTADNVRAFRFTYHKATGNLAIDDVAVTYGCYDTVYVARERYVATDRTLFVGLAAPCVYYYRVRAVNGDHRSEWSPVGQVVTDPDVSYLKGLGLPDVRYGIGVNGVTLYNLPVGSRVEVYGVNGLKHYAAHTFSSVQNLQLSSKGIYIVKVVAKGSASVFKIKY